MESELPKSEATPAASSYANATPKPPASKPGSGPTSKSNVRSAVPRNSVAFNTLPSKLAPAPPLEICWKCVRCYGSKLKAVRFKQACLILAAVLIVGPCVLDTIAFRALAAHYSSVKKASGRARKKLKICQFLNFFQAEGILRLAHNVVQGIEDFRDRHVNFVTVPVSSTNPRPTVDIREALLEPLYTIIGELKDDYLMIFKRNLVDTSLIVQELIKNSRISRRIPR